MRWVPESPKGAQHATVPSQACDFGRKFRFRPIVFNNVSVVPGRLLRVIDVPTSVHHVVCMTLIHHVVLPHQGYCASRSPPIQATVAEEQGGAGAQCMHGSDVLWAHASHTQSRP